MLRLKLQYFELSNLPSLDNFVPDLPLVVSSDVGLLWGLHVALRPLPQILFIRVM